MCVHRRAVVAGLIKKCDFYFPLKKKKNYLALLCKCEAEQLVASGRVADTGPLYIFVLHVIGKAAFALSPPNTKFVWVAASGDKMAINTISQPGISFQQLEGRRRSLWVAHHPLDAPSRLSSKIDWMETIRLSEREKGVEVCGIRGQDVGGKIDYLSDCWVCVSPCMCVWGWDGGREGGETNQELITACPEATRLSVHKGNDGTSSWRCQSVDLATCFPYGMQGVCTEEAT